MTFTPKMPDAIMVQMDDIASRRSRKALAAANRAKGRASRAERPRPRAAVDCPLVLTRADLPGHEDARLEGVEGGSSSSSRSSSSGQQAKEKTQKDLRLWYLVGVVIHDDYGTGSLNQGHYMVIRAGTVPGQLKPCLGPVWWHCDDANVTAVPVCTPGSPIISRGAGRGMVFSHEDTYICLYLSSSCVSVAPGYSLPSVPPAVPIAPPVAEKKSVAVIAVGAPHATPAGGLGRSETAKSSSYGTLATEHKTETEAGKASQSALPQPLLSTSTSLHADPVPKSEVAARKTWITDAAAESKRRPWPEPERRPAPSPALPPRPPTRVFTGLCPRCSRPGCMGNCLPSWQLAPPPPLPPTSGAPGWSGGAAFGAAAGARRPPASAWAPARWPTTMSSQGPSSTAGWGSSVPQQWATAALRSSTSTSQQQLLGRGSSTSAGWGWGAV